MPEVFRAVQAGTTPLVVVLLRLGGALALGALVALIYRRARSAPASSFTATLVLLSILIAMVTQVIGDNVARAFSLVGALSIVRFRTVVRDTQDTAYVIFAVAVGMAAGAGHMSVALAGLGIVGLAAAAMKQPSAVEPEVLPYKLQVRVGLGHDADTLFGPTLDEHLSARRLVSVATVRQGAAVELLYNVAPRSDRLQALVTALNRLDGVQGVTLERAALETE